MKIEEMAIKDLPVVITGNGWNDWDENEVLRKGYILGANAVLDGLLTGCRNIAKELKTHIDNPVDNIDEIECHAGVSIIEDIIWLIKELKGE